MRVLLIDVNGKIPNLALMKLSKWHKARGDNVYLTIMNFLNKRDSEIAARRVELEQLKQNLKEKREKCFG